MHTSILSRLPYNLYCVGGDVKHCSIQSNQKYTIGQLQSKISLYEVY